MEDKSFEINPQVVWFLALGNILFGIVAGVAQIYQWTAADLLFTATLMVNFATWVIIMIDLAHNRVYQKHFWVILMCIMPVIAPLFYLHVREKLHRLGQRVR